MKRDLPDYSSVRPEHAAIHDALCKWAQWVSINGFTYAPPSPTFEMYRHDSAIEMNGAHEKPPSVMPIPCRYLDVKITELPTKNREAIRWAYVYANGGHVPWHIARRKANRGRVGEHEQARKLAVPLLTLQDLIHGGRTMLRNRLK